LTLLQSLLNDSFCNARKSGISTRDGILEKDTLSAFLIATDPKETSYIFRMK